MKDRDKASPGGVQTYRFKDDGTMPNHPFLPVLYYAGAIDEPARATVRFEASGWGNTWENGVYPYHHYHSNAHEALGVVRGSARLQLGGDGGRSLEVRAGDVLVLPAGTGHKRLSASEDFLIAGGYPGGAKYNVRTGEPDERHRDLEEIRLVPIPQSDPVFGPGGPLTELWRPDGR
ncbi:cupin domain-containing protein [Paenibacillus albicereus]|uniref:Cupin domain-containing protein n=1 Tax=Paenibacillus albicereus TaxID=2726185 RepID=A0A6H2H3G8_9BACL|nr:cupin domain-containing protein [Paenibacillus albicereus]QJC53966.1 cupin domain-containing protein [Paenibacillus albicereus]